MSESRCKHKKAISETASVYTAECFALSNALNIIVQNQNNNYIIFSETLSALSTLKSAKLNAKDNPHILEIMYTASNPENFIEFY